MKKKEVKIRGERYGIFFGNQYTEKRFCERGRRGELFKGAAFIAAGVLAASFMTMEIASVVKLGLLAAGVVLCAVGVKWILKYRKDNKAFEEFVRSGTRGAACMTVLQRN